ncbi:hypothetical protein MRB53_013648 [Persea americana]|uniref:Uncharacterized protein n=1 Tax=Persea americana TaxID=3435 RepID=A0ACC2K932_PERAE|nr:hypothetical protein MRB53_013648 [Persea americana]
MKEPLPWRHVHWHPTSTEACLTLPKINLSPQRRSSQRSNPHKRGPPEGSPPGGSLHEGDPPESGLGDHVTSLRSPLAHENQRLTRRRKEILITSTEGGFPPRAHEGNTHLRKWLLFIQQSNKRLITYGGLSLAAPIPLLALEKGCVEVDEDILRVRLLWKPHTHGEP